MSVRRFDVCCKGGWDGCITYEDNCDDGDYVTFEDYASLLTRHNALEEALKRGVELHENCDADTCMCGESMRHPLVDHTPTAMLQYYGDQWAEEARRALEEK